MKSKRTIIPTLSLGQNFRLVMTQEGITFKQFAKKAKVSSATAYGLVERTPFLITEQLLRAGKALGFSETQVREAVWEDRLKKDRPHSKKEKLYQLMGQIVELFDSKGV